MRSLCGEVKLIPRDHICSDLGHEAAELTALKLALLCKGSRCQLAPDSASTKIKKRPQMRSQNDKETLALS